MSFCILYSLLRVGLSSLLLRVGMNPVFYYIRTGRNRRERTTIEPCVCIGSRHTVDNLLECISQTSTGSCWKARFAFYRQYITDSKMPDC